QHALALLAVQYAGEVVFAHPGCAHVAAPQLGHPGTSGHREDGLSCEPRADQRVTNAHVAIEVRQRRDTLRLGLVALDHDGQPETQLAEPDRRGTTVDTENRTRQDVASE